MRLTATNYAGASTETKTDYIVVTSPTTTDTHDGFDEETQRKVKEKVREEEKAFRSRRDKLRSVHAHASFDRLGRYVQFHTGRTRETVAVFDLRNLPPADRTK